MKSPTPRFAFIVALLACVPLLPAAPGKTRNPASSEQVPDGLSRSDWQSIRAAYDAGRHVFTPAQGGTFAAENPGQQMRAVVDARGFTATASGAEWGLELTGFGWAGREVPPRGISRSAAEGPKFTRTWPDGLEEWLVNDGRGLEHGFTVPARPGGAAGGVLRFLLAVRGELQPEVEPGGQSVRFVRPEGGAVLIYSGLKVWDADGDILPAYMAPAPNGISIEVNEAGARYPLTVDPVVQQAYLKPAAVGTTQLGDTFGTSVAVSGNTVVVGAPFEDSSTTGVNSTPNESAPGAGAAYVFVRSGGAWTQQAYLKAGNAGAGDQFGGAVAVDGDTVVVGARLEDSSSTGVNSTPNENAADAGAVYVFVRSGETWTQEAYLKTPNAGTTQAGDQFGGAVAVDGDTVVVGARLEDSTSGAVNESAADAGAAWVFVRSGTTWASQVRLKALLAGTTQVNDRFGVSVGVSGDTVVVGADGEDSSTTAINSVPNEGASGAGAAYVFVRSGTSWSQQAYLKAANAGGGDFFGISVAVSGDTVVAGAHFEDSGTTGVNSTPNEGASNSGAAYVFSRSGTTWTQQAYLKAGNTGASDSFGITVAVSGDTVMVGASQEDSATTGLNSIPDESAGNSGAAYIFGRTGTTWAQQTYLKASNTGAGDGFGSAVAVSGPTVVAGAPGESSGSTGVNSTPDEIAAGAGAVYTTTTLLDLTVEHPPGTPLVNGSAANFGSVAVGASSVPQTFALHNPNPEDLTGLTVTLDGGLAGDFALSTPSSTTVPAGGTVTFAIAFTPGAPDARTATLRYRVSGELFVHDLPLRGNGLGRELISAVQQAYAKPAPVGMSQLGDLFGTAVAVSDDTVVVGAPGEDSSTTGVNSTPDESAPGAGAAYVFVRSGATWMQQAYLKASNTGAGDVFGGSVAISGDTIAVGAPYEASSSTGVNSAPNDGAARAGAAYIFVRNGTTWTQQAYLKPAAVGTAQDDDEFGISVAISGDTVVVGAWLEASSTSGTNSLPNDSTPGAGAAYVFVRNGTAWTQQAYLKTHAVDFARFDDHFGRSVAISGDTVVVGAPGEDSTTQGINSTPNEVPGIDTGAAFIFMRNGTTWAQQAYVKASNTGVQDAFGSSVAVADDTVAVGAPGEHSGTTGINPPPDENAPGAGAAYVFVRSGTDWVQQAFLKAGNTGAGDNFGFSVAVSGNVLVAGALAEDSSTLGINGPPNESEFNSGAAYVFVRNTTAWTQRTFLKASNTGFEDIFGYAVAASGDTVVAGARREWSSTTGINSTPNNNAVNAGAAYIFAGGIAIEQPEGTIIPPSGGRDLDLGIIGSFADSTFTIRNTGATPFDLTGTPEKVAVSGADAGHFTVIPQLVSPVSAGGSTTFTVRFTPVTTGVRTALLTIPNTSNYEGFQTVHLNAIGLSLTVDTDGDGLNDASEFQMAALGFDWQVAQPALVATLFNNVGGAQSNLNAAGFFTPAQVQALHMDVPLLQRAPGTGLFTFTFGLQKSATLTPGSFVPFPFTPAGISVNPAGKVEFQFTSPDNAAFFRLEPPP